MALGLNTVRMHVLIFTQSFIIKGTINIPANMRFSDALNKFMKDRSFLAITGAEIESVEGTMEVQKVDFMLVNRERVVGISPIE
ncbi:MAG: hypothetical protein U9Q18_02110 [Caldisericota bacterium]|nr:hypothetical protein [Caldisericota bacterium]